MFYLLYKYYSESLAQYILAVLMGFFSIVAMEIRYYPSIFMNLFWLEYIDYFVYEYDIAKQQCNDIEMLSDIFDDEMDREKLIFN